ncbi:type II toxin-antitoxin system death-on-curing family toxin [Sulfitobacter sp. R18_1]|uniref:type II toxin-antitoxin system death-on-curing family toxin n=1 Tax=Sulfitobacter sp. R18_1 TaxID=2821104 RepID=UPI001AD9BA9E|nr:type II toxin-antitoxin system death-on-curing family toxin [Sulfitobacter sp. R18_1]MBO9428569.1 type II toxin-antitoxin system death-on-curing family toxin [Sulfitobacter sp. R18_1]
MRDEYQTAIDTVVDRVIQAHDIQLAKFGGSEGLRDRNLLESAVGRVMQAIALTPEGEFDALDATAMLTHSILKAHAFVDGNKRAGFANMMGMLDQAGFELPLRDIELEDKMVELASSSGGFEVISDWLRENVVLRDGYEAADIKKMPSVAPK